MINVDGVCRAYAARRGMFQAVRDVSFRVEQGEWVTVVGPSGSGKSTLLNLITGLDHPTSGSVIVAGADLTALGEDALASWRARHVGIVFQFFQLLPTLTALENVLLPMALAGRKGDRRADARALLAAVGVGDVADHLPGELSGGEQQRVAIARALANEPPLLVADEPTGNLDAASGGAVLDLLVGYWRRGGTLVTVTHDPAVAARAPRVLTMADGEIVESQSGRALRALTA